MIIIMITIVILIITLVVPVVVLALGSIPLRSNDNLRTIEVPVELIRRCALLGSTKILRKVLEMQRRGENKQRVSLGFPRQLVVAQS